MDQLTDSTAKLGRGGKNTILKAFQWIIVLGKNVNLKKSMRVWICL